MKLTRHNPMAMTLEIPSEATQTFTIMLASDVHFDSISCDIKRFTDHLTIANETKSPVFIAGDFFDAMQGRDDPRRSPEELKDEYKVLSYFDALVLYASEFLQQFDQVPLWLFGLGNHETSVLNKASTNLIDRLAYALRLHGVKAEAAGYWGYLRFMFRYTKGRDGVSRMLYWHHGTGGGNSPVTRGVIDTNRQAVFLHDADFVLNGHNHHAYVMPIQVEKVNKKTMVPYTRSVWYLRTPGYQMSAPDSKRTLGFAAERHRSPQPRGCMFLDLTYRKHGNAIEAEIRQKIG